MLTDTHPSFVRHDSHGKPDDLTKSSLDTRAETGYIGFQDHALPLSLRNIKIGEL